MREDGGAFRLNARVWACKMIEVARFAPCSGFLYRKQYVVGLARIDGRDAFIINSGTNRANEGNAAAVALNICATILTMRAENSAIARGRSSTGVAMSDLRFKSAGQVHQTAGDGTGSERHLRHALPKFIGARTMDALGRCRFPRLR